MFIAKETIICEFDRTLCEFSLRYFSSIFSSLREFSISVVRMRGEEISHDGVKVPFGTYDYDNTRRFVIYGLFEEKH